MNKTGYKSLDKLSDSNKVDLIYQDNDGIWIELAEGWKFEECISIRADSCRDAFRQVSQTYNTAAA